MLLVLSEAFHTKPHVIDWKKVVAVNIPILTLLYFSVIQYSKAKNLRIENANKAAIVKGFKGFTVEISDDDEDTKRIFLQNIASVLFTKITEHKGRDMPIDEVLKLAQIFKKQQ